jgi:type IV pilus assembly protein PilP
MLIYLVSITVLLGSVDCFAKSVDEPIVIRKKINPFEPLFREKPRKKANRLTPKIIDRQNVTTLEKLNLNQLKLTGIIFASKRKLALVQEASGKGHIISVGTFIGTKGGTVSEIQKNKVLIQETLVDAYGNTVIQKNELKLRNKPTV